MNELTVQNKGAVDRPAPTVADMLQAVIAHGVTADNVGALEKLAAMHERMEEKQSERAYNAALAALQRECQNVIATKDVDGKFRYAPFLNLWNSVRPHLEHNGFTLEWSQDNIGDRVTVTLTLRHSAGYKTEKNYTIRVGTNAPGTPSGAQAPVLDTQAGTRAKRLLLINALNIVVDAVSDASDVGDGSLATDEETDALCKRLMNLTDDPASQKRFLQLAGVDSWNKITKAVLPILQRLMSEKERAAARKGAA